MVTPEGIQQAQAAGDVSQMTPEELLWQLRQTQPDPVTEESYYRQQLQEFSRAKEAEAQVLQMLNGHDMPLTAYNIMAATRILEGRSVFKSLFSHESLSQEIDLEEVKEKLPLIPLGVTESELTAGRNDIYLCEEFWMNFISPVDRIKYPGCRSGKPF